MSSSAITGPVLADNKRAPSGTAAAPSFAFNASTGTGVYLVSSDVLGLSTAGVQRVVVDASGNVGIGTGSPTGQLEISNTSDPTSLFYRLSNGAGVGIGRITWDGQNSSSARASYARIQAEIQTNTAGAHGGALAFYTAGSGAVAERARIDASGNFMLGRTEGTNPALNTPGFFYYASSTVPTVYSVVNTNGLVNSYHVYNQNATNNGYRFYVKADGGIANFSGNNSNLSDERTKTDIKPAGNYLEKICAIPVRTFRYKDQGDDLEPTLGVIAQEVEKVAPELVNTTDGFGDTPEDGIPLKTIYTTDMQFALMKALQELKAELDEAKAKIAALESK